MYGPKNFWGQFFRKFKKLLKSISSFIFQAIFFKLLQSNLYTITKKRYMLIKKN